MLKQINLGIIIAIAFSLAAIAQDVKTNEIINENEAAQQDTAKVDYNDALITKQKSLDYEHKRLRDIWKKSGFQPEELSIIIDLIERIDYLKACYHVIVSGKERQSIIFEKNGQIRKPTPKKELSPSENNKTEYSQTTKLQAFFTSDAVIIDLYSAMETLSTLMANPHASESELTSALLYARQARESYNARLNSAYKELRSKISEAQAIILLQRGTFH